MDEGIKQELFSLRSSLSLSIAAHVLFLILCATLISYQPATPWKRTTIIELEPLPQDLAKKNKDETKPNQKLVQTVKGQKTDKAAPDAFLGEQTQTVDRQTVSRDKMIQMGESKTTTAKHDTVSKPQKKSAKEIAKKPAVIPMQNLGLPILPDTKQQAEIAKEASQGHDNSNFVSSGEQAPEDYIRGLKEGEQTALNTREFMFYGYYQRIREKLDRAWVPILHGSLVALYRKGRTLATEMDYSTKVMVVMNRAGEITRVQVQTESGAHDLDEAAVKAFNQAGPFPNPPKGMIDARGEIKIPWEFILRT